MFALRAEEMGFLSPFASAVMQNAMSDLYRYGLASLEFKTIAETAAFFHLTEKHMRLIEERSLAKLRTGMNDGKIL